LIADHQHARRHAIGGLLIIDEFGYLPIDGADLLFKVISQRYERARM
jgi:DNA replication protein DnaC